MATAAGQMTQTVQSNPQWVPCDGSFISGYVPLPAPPRPHTGASTGTRRDYWRNNMGFSRTRGIGGWLIGMPYDPAGTWRISTADDSSEATIPNAPTPANPPPGVK